MLEQFDKFDQDMQVLNDYLESGAIGTFEEAERDFSMWADRKEPFTNFPTHQGKVSTNSTVWDDEL